MPLEWMKRYEVWECDPAKDHWRVSVATNDEADALYYYEWLQSTGWLSAIVERTVYA